MQPNELRKRAEKVADRWKLSLDDELKLAKRRAVYKVRSPQGPAVLKLYQKIGSSGENGAIQFLRALPAGVGAKVYRVSPLRTAILIEWLDGTALDQLVAEGNEHEAEAHLASVAAKLAAVHFRFHATYRKLRENRVQTPIASSVQEGRKDLSSRTARLLDHLRRTTRRETIIHGDLVFRNTMLTPDGPRVFDAKGFRADPAAEFRLVTVPPHRSRSVTDFIDCTLHRATLFADATGYDRLRIVQWATVVSVNRFLQGSLKDVDPSEIDPYLTALLEIAQA